MVVWRQLSTIAFLMWKSGQTMFKQSGIYTQGEEAGVQVRVALTNTKPWFGHYV